MALPPYLEQNRIRIINAPDQQIALWNSSYDKLVEHFEVVKRIYRRHPDRNMQRNDVIKFFREDQYTGFIAAMMWGGINATRPSKNGGPTSFVRLLNSTLLNQVLCFLLSKSAALFLCLFSIASHTPCVASSLLTSDRAMTSLTSGHESKGQSSCSSMRA